MFFPIKDANSVQHNSIYGFDPDAVKIKKLKNLKVYVTVTPRRDQW